MILICGLGNPGHHYLLSRHNVGFLVLDYFAKHYGCDFSLHKFNAWVAETKILEQKVLFFKPQTFMNRSGESVKAFCDFYKIPSDNLIVIYDDVDLPFGDVRAKAKGGTAGHKGMDSIVEMTGTDHFHRIRLGIGRPLDARIEISDYVLSPFTQEEQKVLPERFQKALEILEKTVAGLK